MRVSAVSLLALVAAVSLGTAFADTTGTRFQGYTYASDVQGYVNMTQDYCDIVAAIRANNFTAAEEIYQTGKNSFAGVSRRTFYRFASHVPTDYEPLYEALTMGRNGSWLDDAIKQAFAAEDGPLALGLIQVATLKYMVHEVDAAAHKIATYAANTTQTNLLDDESGAPHNVDEAAALWFGGSPDHCGTLASWAQSLGNNLDTLFVHVSPLNMAATAALNEFLATARSGDSAALNATRSRMAIALQMMGMQGVMLGAYKANLAANCGRAADVDAAKTDIVVHWTYLRPLLLSLRPAGAANFAGQVDSLQSALTASNVNYDQVLMRIINVLASMGRRLHEVGQPNFSIVNAGWRCPAYTQP